MPGQMRWPPPSVPPQAPPHLCRQLSADWAVGGDYEFTVHGPNGFLRELKGSAPGAEVGTRHDGDDEEIRLVLTNSGGATVRLTVTDAYGSRPATFHLRPGGRATHVAELRRSNGWYDLSVVSDRDPAFLRRLAGHVETGRPSTSDPAVATV